eukprot:CAMPEP_0194425064 /NCGR_PEP_ID=MMETSP0176-20130528/24398_1 /TAXON_ID=216777 /ORGANISM="Proboscia alata, Strain PI-D3" /LENGTH=715 /DNA_ID=CAMNT_0039235229 /DNA_START=126 /DNA_END=2273 /DNA_ORIENTATION=+
MTYLTSQNRKGGENCAEKRKLSSIERFDDTRQCESLLPNQIKSKRLIAPNGIFSDNRPSSMKTSDYREDYSMCDVGADSKPSASPVNRKACDRSLNDHHPRASSHSKSCDGKSDTGKLRIDDAQKLAESILMKLPSSSRRSKRKSTATVAITNGHFYNKNDSVELDQMRELKKRPLKPHENNLTEIEVSNNGQSNSHHNFVGKKIKIISGKFRGLEARIAHVATRGWWKLDNPIIGKEQCIHSRHCRFIDKTTSSSKSNELKTKAAPPKADEGVTTREMRHKSRDLDFYSHKSQFSSPSSKKRRSKSPRSFRQGTTAGEPYTKGGPVQDIKENTVAKKYRKAAIPSKRGTYVTKCRIRNYSVGPIDFLNFIDFKFFEFLTRKLKIQSKAHPIHKALPPVLLNDGESTVPVALRHLSPDTRIEILDRRSCKVINGDNAPRVTETMATLKRHSEYEPVVPHQLTNAVKCNKMHMVSLAREGRSAINVRVNSSVVPQGHTKANLFCKGQEVLVIDGPHRGLCGKASNILSSGWCYVSDLQPEQPDIDVIIRTADLEPIESKGVSNGATNVNIERLHVIDMNQKRLLRRSIKLRLEALAQEGKQIKTLLKRKKLDTTTRDGDVVHNDKSNGKRGIPKLAVSQMMKNIQMRLSKEECTDAECSYSMMAKPTISPNDVTNGYRFSSDNSGRGGINNIGGRLQQIENMVVQLKSIEKQSCSR